MRKAFVATLILSSIGIAAAHSDPLSDIRANCKSDWPGDYSMQEYCIGQQIEAFNNVAEIHNGTLNEEERGILLKCFGDWQKPVGSDWTMVEYCYQQQHGAYRRLNEE